MKDDLKRLNKTEIPFLVSNMFSANSKPINLLRYWNLSQKCQVKTRLGTSLLLYFSIVLNKIFKANNTKGRKMMAEGNYLGSHQIKLVLVALVFLFTGNYVGIFSFRFKQIWLIFSRTWSVHWMSKDSVYMFIHVCQIIIQQK